MRLSQSNCTSNGDGRILQGSLLVRIYSLISKNNSPINEFIFRIQKNTYLFNKYGIPFEKEWINDNSKGIDDFLKYINS